MKNKMHLYCPQCGARVYYKFLHQTHDYIRTLCSKCGKMDEMYTIEELARYEPLPNPHYYNKIRSRNRLGRN